MKQEVTRKPMWGRIAIAALSSFLLCLVLTASGSPPLPDSVKPCRPCHGRSAGGQVGEWLASPYSESEGGRGCTHCHAGRCSGNGGPRERVDLESLRDALLLKITASCAGEAVNVEVAVSNVGVGHLLPSAAGGRDLVLSVDARDHTQELAPWPAGSSRLQLPPFSTEVSRYRFISPHSGPVEVSARLTLEQVNESILKVAEATTVCSATGGES
jgi:hypothetical protein